MQNSCSWRCLQTSWVLLAACHSYNCLLHFLSFLSSPLTLANLETIWNGNNWHEGGGRFIMKCRVSLQKNVGKKTVLQTKYRIRNTTSHKVHLAVAWIFRLILCFMWTKSSLSILERPACRLFKSGASGYVIYPVTLPYSICSNDFYINLFVYYGWVNAALRNVNVLPSNFCLVLMNIDVVLKGGWSLFICVCITCRGVKMNPMFLERAVYTWIFLQNSASYSGYWLYFLSAYFI